MKTHPAPYMIETWVGSGTEMEFLKEEQVAVCSTQEKETSDIPDDYQCSGNLEQDYVELCTISGISEIPKIVPRIRRHFSPVSDKSASEEMERMLEKETRASFAEIRERLACFRPRIQVNLENEDPKSVREIFIRGWKIDQKMMDVFSKCLPALQNLQTINLWNVNLTEKTLDMLADFLPRCLNLKTLVLDGNPLFRKSYYRLFSEESTLTNVFLRNNKIDNEGTWFITQALQDLNPSNKHLVSLNLSYNHISDQGAKYLAEVLRLNRTLLSLSLAHNEVGDEGALYLAEVLGHFALTTQEVVERRYLLLGKETLDHQKSPSPTKTAEGRTEHPQTLQSTVAIDKTEKIEKPQVTKSIKSASKKKEKEQIKKEEKTGSVTQPGAASGQGGVVKKEDPKLTKKQAAGSEPKKGKGPKSASRDRTVVLPEPEAQEITEILHPLLEPVEHKDGRIFISGNRTLINLNLSMNKITERGLKSFLAAIEYQALLVKSLRGGHSGTGLLRLSLGKNNFPPDNPTFLKIQELMAARDPMKKPGEDEQVSA